MSGAQPDTFSHVFTPRVPLGNPWHAPGGQEPGRVMVRVSTRPGDFMRRIDEERGQWLRVDTDHGPMLVISAPCGGDCYCDALAIPVGTPAERRPQIH